MDTSEVLRTLKIILSSTNGKKEKAGLMRAIRALESTKKYDSFLNKYVQRYSKDKMLFVAKRGDGLTMRLGAIIYAIFFANKYNGTFRFKWGKGFANDAFHSIESVEELFEQSFIEEFLLDELDDFSFYDLEKVNPQDLDSKKPLFEHRGWDISRYAQRKIPPQLVLDSNDKEQLSQLIHSIPFTPRYKRAIKLANDVDLSSGEIVGIHVRSGDIIYGQYRLCGRYVKGRSLPILLVDELIRLNLKAGKRVLLFSGDLNLLNCLKEKYDVLTPSDFLQNDELGAEAVIYDSVLMSRCKSLYAAGSSGVTKLAQVIGKVNISTPIEYWVNTSVNKIQLELAKVEAAYDELQSAYSYYHAYLKFRGGNNKVADAFLDKAIELDPNNSLYLILKFEWCIQTQEFLLAEQNIARYFEVVNRDAMQKKLLGFQLKSLMDIDNTFSILASNKFSKEVGEFIVECTTYLTAELKYKESKTVTKIS